MRHSRGYYGLNFIYRPFSPLRKPFPDAITLRSFNLNLMKYEIRVLIYFNWFAGDPRGSIIVYYWMHPSIPLLPAPGTRGEDFYLPIKRPAQFMTFYGITSHLFKYFYYLWYHNTALCGSFILTLIIARYMSYIYVHISRGLQMQLQFCTIILVQSKETIHYRPILILLK